MPKPDQEQMRLMRFHGFVWDAPSGRFWAPYTGRNFSPQEAKDWYESLTKITAIPMEQE